MRSSCSILFIIRKPLPGSMSASLMVKSVGPMPQQLRLRNDVLNTVFICSLNLPRSHLYRYINITMYV